MLDLVFSTYILLTLAVLGAPAAYLLPRTEFQYRALAAPALGLSVLSILATLGYRAGASLHVIGSAILAILLLGAAAAIVAVVSRRLSARLSYRGFLIVAVPAFVLLVLPALTGGQQFAVFQGNHFDQLTYLTLTVGMRHAGFRELSVVGAESSPDAAIVAFAGWMIDHRPGLPILFGATLEVFDRPAVLMSYPYLASIAFVVVPTITFLLVNLLGMSLGSASILSAALGVGFFVQYVLDINAWGQLGGTAPALMGTGLVITTVAATRPSRATIVACSLLLGLVVGGLLFIYPVFIAVLGVPLLFVAIAFARGKGLSAWVPLLVSMVPVLVYAVTNWTRALGDWSMHAAEASRPVEWWVYFQRYLLGRDVDLLPLVAQGWLPDRPVDRVYALASFPLDFAAGLLGFSLFLPTGDIGLVWRAAWKLVLGGLSVFLILLSAASLVRGGSREEPRARCFACLCLLCLSLPIAILCTGRVWTAGRALSLVGPLVFVSVAAIPRWGSQGPLGDATRVLFVAGHVLFGLYRPVAATNDAGIHYRLPYPGIQDEALKREFSWDLRELAARAPGCRSVQLKVDNPFLSRYVRLLLYDLGVHWSATTPPGATPACLVTTEVALHHAKQQVFSLARDLRLVEFLEGRRDSLDLVPSTPNGIHTTGLYALEHLPSGETRWTNGGMRILVPLMGGARPRSLEVGLAGLVPNPDTSLEVLVNGRLLHSGTAGDTMASHVAIPDDGSDAVAIEVRSPTFNAPPDTRKLGVPLRRLRLTR